MIKKCLGCGIELQNKFESEVGFVQSLDHDYCKRCFLIKNYSKCLNIVKDNDDYMKILDDIKSNDVVMLVVDLFAFNNLDSFIKMINSKNIILIINKRDIFPKSLKNDKIKNYFSNYDVIDVIVVSALKDDNIKELYDVLNSYKDNKIYFVGFTNSGKSTLINRLVANYGDEKQVITTSIYPATTLETIKIVIGDITIVDTPGIVDQGNITTYLNNSDLKRVMIKKRIKPLTYQITQAQTLAIDKYAYLHCSDNNTSLIFFVAPVLTVKKVNAERINSSYKRYVFENCEHCDIVISGLGFIKITNKIDIVIYTYNDVLVYKRDPLI